MRPAGVRRAARRNAFAARGNCLCGKPRRQRSDSLAKWRRDNGCEASANMVLGRGVVGPVDGFVYCRRPKLTPARTTYRWRCRDALAVGRLRGQLDADTEAYLAARRNAEMHEDRSEAAQRLRQRRLRSWIGARDSRLARSHTIAAFDCGLLNVLRTKGAFLHWLSLFDPTSKLEAHRIVVLERER